jgi:hypothetical protein
MNAAKPENFSQTFITKAESFVRPTPGRLAQAVSQPFHGSLS